MVRWRHLRTVKENEEGMEGMFAQVLNCLNEVSSCKHRYEKFQSGKTSCYDYCQSQQSGRYDNVFRKGNSYNHCQFSKLIDMMVGLEEVVILKIASLSNQGHLIRLLVLFIVIF